MLDWGAWQGARDPLVVTLAGELRRAAATQAPSARRGLRRLATDADERLVNEVRAICRWVATRVTYRPDGAGEMIEMPLYTLRARAADCDGMVALTLALAGALHIDGRAVWIWLVERDGAGAMLGGRALHTVAELRTPAGLLYADPVVKPGLVVRSYVAWAKAELPAGTTVEIL